MGGIGGIGREGVGMGLKSYYNACMKFSNKTFKKQLL